MLGATASSATSVAASPSISPAPSRSSAPTLLWKTVRAMPLRSIAWAATSA